MQMTFWKKLSKRLPFHDKAVLPSERLLLWMLLGIPITWVGSFWGIGWLLFSLYHGLLFSFTLIDLLWMRKMPTLTVTRRAKDLFEIGEENTVMIRIQASAPLKTRMWVQDDYPHGFKINRRTLFLRWDDEQQKECSYQTWPHRRGRHPFHKIHLRLESKRRLWRIQQSFQVPLEVKVYPRLEAVRRVRKGFYQRQLALEGSSIRRIVRVGHEFSHIREYLPDDDPRQINWMVTARRGKLVSNLYHPEAGQQVAILLDCGRLMGIQNDGKTRLDYALEAALGYAAIALQRGEQVSFLAFSDQVQRFVPLGKGMEQLQRIIEASYDLEPSYVETDYLKTWNLLSSHHKSQALVTLFTDAANISFAQNIQTWIAMANRTYRVMTVTMQDPKLLEVKKKAIEREEDVYQQMVVDQLLQEREEVFQKWKKRKVDVLDVEPEQLAFSVIDSYLKIRSRAAAGQ